MRRSDRSTTDLLILLLAVTVCAVIVLSTLTISIVKIIKPGTDTVFAGQVVANVINTLIGLLAGWLAGRTSRKQGGGEDQ